MSLNRMFQARFLALYARRYELSMLGRLEALRRHNVSHARRYNLAAGGHHGITAVEVGVMESFTLS